MSTSRESDFTRRARWPQNESGPEAATVREVVRTPSTERTRAIRERFLSAKMMLDSEFAHGYTCTWREHDGEPLLIRRALAYCGGLDAMTPVIFEDEPLVVSKSRFPRGAVPYLQYSAKFFAHFLQNLPEPQEADIYALGIGGGLAARTGIRQVGGMFGVLEEDVTRLAEASAYWNGRCLEDVADRWLAGNFPENTLLQNAFETVVFPPSVISIMEGRWIPAYDMVVERGLEDIIRECEEHIRTTVPTTREVAEQCLFWRASVLACQGILRWVGRYAQLARRMAQSISCTCGDCPKCPAVKLDPVSYRSVQLNMKLHPEAIRGQEGSRRLVDLCKSYFDSGGYHVQFNVVDSEMLRDAQRNPDKYRDLIVRVAGFSAYWVELSKPVQDELIARTEYLRI